ncbi:MULTISPECIES: hypothetical protein [Inquilinus]|uniref:Uncharacterized protein n=1 Tax=Inquilinus ginsengisoli TaxID=363840 RepID=A0ABU1JWD8_9PROT|nr:hypothetical protein [Inquilinus ginsengisoli]MDR6292930.1 hypothetical protein [Inquilinus ginsengisoli]
MTTSRSHTTPEQQPKSPEHKAAKASRKVDEASADSMDASDPPSFNPGTAGTGEDRRSAKPVPKAPARR